MPWIVSLGFAVVIGTVALLNLRLLRRLWAQYRSGNKNLDDDWDPFT